MRRCAFHADCLIWNDLDNPNMFEVTDRRAERWLSENLQCKNGETSSAGGDPLDLCDQPLLLYNCMNFLGTPQLRGGVFVFFFYNVSFLKHPNAHGCNKQIFMALNSFSM